LKYIEKIYKYIKDTDIQVYKGNTLDNDDKSDEIENKIENKDEDEDIIINKNLSYIENTIRYLIEEWHIIFKSPKFSIKGYFNIHAEDRSFRSKEVFIKELSSIFKFLKFIPA